MTQCPPLVEILAEIPDFRKEKGKRHLLSAFRGFICSRFLDDNSSLMVFSVLPLLGGTRDEYVMK